MESINVVIDDANGEKISCESIEDNSESFEMCTSKTKGLLLKNDYDILVYKCENVEQTHP